MINKIIPTIFALNIEIFNFKLDKLSFSKEIHLDFMDGNFTKNKSIKINDMLKIKEYGNINFEIHLMAKNPIQYLEQIKKLNIKKVLIQIEIFKNLNDFENTIKKFKKNKIEVFIVLNPKTKIEKINEKIIDGIMLMSVNPGYEGQNFIKNTYDRISEIKKTYSKKINIQIDGGINLNNTKELIKKGANILSVGSYLTSNINPENNFKKLENLIKN